MLVEVQSNICSGQGEWLNVRSIVRRCKPLGVGLLILMYMYVYRDGITYPIRKRETDLGWEFLRVL